MGFFVCFPVIKPHIADTFSTLWKILTFTSSITSGGLVHCQSCFAQVFTEEQEKQFSPFSLLQGYVKTFHGWQAQLAPTPLNNHSWEAAWYGSQRADAGNKVERKRKNGRKRAGSENSRPASIRSQLRPSPDEKQVQEGTTSLLGAPLRHQLSEGRP